MTAGINNLVVVMSLSALASTGCAGPITSRQYPTELEQINTWHGDYPTVPLGRFPEAQQGIPAGFIGSAEAFSHMWLVFRPADPIPAIDFREHIVVPRAGIRYIRVGEKGRIPVVPP